MDANIYGYAKPKKFNSGEVGPLGFQSTVYPTCPPGIVGISTNDDIGQDLLWEYANRYRTINRKFADALQRSLILDGYTPPNAIDQALDTWYGIAAITAAASMATCGITTLGVIVIWNIIM